jgi:hypothetical protein
MTTLAAILLAALGACCFAGSARLQHGAVRSGNPGESLSVRSLGRVLRTRRWLAGAGLAVVGGALHVVALSLAPLVVVQPVGVLGLVVVTGRFRPAVVGVCLGVAGFVVLAARSGVASGGISQPGATWFFAPAAIAVAAAALSIHGRARCFGLAAAAAVLFGTGSALIRAATHDLAAVTGLSLAAESLLLIAAGGWLVQQAYAAGPPAVVIAVTTVIDPFTAVVIGLTRYGEAAHTTPASAVAQGGFAGLAIAGVLVLARSIPDPRAPERNPTCASCSPRTPSPRTSTGPRTSPTGWPAASRPADTTCTCSAPPTPPPREPRPTVSSPSTG